ncbi:hypothetical protein BaRGS_00034525, partial [Batillaria attramentaria]
ETENTTREVADQPQQQGQGVGEGHRKQFFQRNRVLKSCRDEVLLGFFRPPSAVDLTCVEMKVFSTRAFRFLTSPRGDDVFCV